MASSSTSRRRGPLKDGACEIIYNVYMYLKANLRSIQVGRGGLGPFDGAITDVAAKLTGVSESSVRRVAEKGKKNESFSPPPKKKRRDKFIVDELTKSAIRRKIQELYIIKNSMPSVKVLNKRLKEDEILNCGCEFLRKLLIDMGYERCQSHRKEKPGIVDWTAGQNTNGNLVYKVEEVFEMKEEPTLDIEFDVEEKFVPDQDCFKFKTDGSTSNTDVKIVDVAVKTEPEDVAECLHTEDDVITVDAAEDRETKCDVQEGCYDVKVDGEMIDQDEFLKTSRLKPGGVNSTVEQLLTPSGQKNERYICPTCDCEFKCGATLYNHVLVHSGAKPYECDLCKKTFQHKRTVAAHVLSHYSIKPFKCKICKSMFATSGLLNSHRMSKHPERTTFNYIHCGSSFPSIKAVRAHVNSNPDSK